MRVLRACLAIAIAGLGLGAGQRPSTLYVTGVVQDDAGRPVDGMRVTASGKQASPAVTDSDGTFTLTLTSDVQLGDDVHLHAEDLRGRFAVWTGTVAAAARARTIPIIVKRLGTASAPPALPRFRNPNIVENVLRGTFTSVSYDERYAKTYVAAVARLVSKRCQAPFTLDEIGELTARAELPTIDVSSSAGDRLAMYEKLKNYYAGRRTAAADEPIRADDVDALPVDAEHDAESLVTRQGCRGAEVATFGRQVRLYVNAPRLSADALLATCGSSTPSTFRPRSSDFCLCFVAKLTHAPMPTSTRQGLASTFWDTAARLIAHDEPRYRPCFPE